MSICKDTLGSEPLFYAVQGCGNKTCHGDWPGFVEIARLLGPAKASREFLRCQRANVEISMLHLACEFATLEMVKVFLDAKADVNERSSIPASPCL